MATKANKELFYNTLKQTIKPHKNDISHVLGDFNARIQIKQGPHENCIGEHTFDKQNITISHQNEDVSDSRERCITLCTENTLMIMHATFQQPNEQLFTHKTGGESETTPSWIRPQFETIVFEITINRF